jgi:photosystem II stability/assembly factor-like uncharacterized protein
MSLPSVRVRTALFVAVGALCLGVNFGTLQVGASTKTSGSIGGVLKANEAGVTGPHALIVANLVGIYKTTDAGRHWTNITPPLISSQPEILSHLVSIVSFGNERIWLECEGDARFDFIPYTWNGGTTWRTSVLPSDVDNPAALQFTGAEDGWATANVGASPQRVAVRTVDGGDAWVLASKRTAPKPPVSGQRPSDVKQRVPVGFTIVRTYRASRVLSWALAATAAGGTYLLETTDGGSVWKTVSLT